MIDLCRENEIILFCLPPHTTHALQPLDVAVFKSLKDNSATFAKPSFMVTKREFSKVICEPFEVVFSIINIKAGFLKCVIHPFNPGAIEAAKMLQSASYGFSNDSSTSSSEQSSASSPAPVPVRGESSRIRNSMPLSAISSGSNSDSNYPSSGSITLSASDCSSGGSSLSISTTPPTDPQNSSGVSYSTPTLNLLVRAGLIPPHLADLTTSPATKEPNKSITGANLTASEYYEWLQEEE